MENVGCRITARPKRLSENTFQRRRIQFGVPPSGGSSVRRLKAGLQTGVFKQTLSNSALNLPTGRARLSSARHRVVLALRCAEDRRALPGSGSGTYCAQEVRGVLILVGCDTPCAPQPCSKRRLIVPTGAHGVTRPTLQPKMRTAGTVSCPRTRSALLLLALCPRSNRYLD